MLNCPKCGFLQPRDQYCAKCGVDMLSYRPSTPPFRRRLVQNSFFQLSFLIIAIISIFSWIRYQQETELAARIRELNNSQKIAESSLATSDAASHSDAVTSNADRQASSTDTGATSHTKTAPAGAPSADADSTAATLAEPAPPRPGASDDSSTSNSGTTTSTQTASTSFRVYFAELPRTFVAEMLNEARDVTRLGNIATGVIANLDSRVKQNPTSGRWQIDSSEAQSLKPNEPIPVFRGVRDTQTGRNLGFAIEVTQVAIDEGTSPAANDGGLRLHIEALRTLRDIGANPPIEEAPIPLPELFEIPKGGAAFLAGVLPRRQLKEEDERLYQSIKALRVMTSENFKSGLSEFVIFIEAK